MRIDQPFHEGELLMQERAGERTRGERTGRVISDTIIPGAIPFLAKQTTLVLGSVDPLGRVWASVLFGRPGFVVAPDDRAVELDLTMTVELPGDPLWSSLRGDPRVGLLAIDLETRRRLRVNGRVSELDADRARIEVVEAYPNCPKYIQRRRLVADWTERPDVGRPSRSGTALDPETRDLLARADTLFVASAHPDRGVDASHRGGGPGFVRVLDDATLRIPDYPGNSMFNTLGNFELHPHAGVVVPDFETGRWLQMVGCPEIRWDLEDLDEESGGTSRFWDFHVSEWRCTDMSESLRLEALDRQEEEK